MYVIRKCPIIPCDRYWYQHHSLAISSPQQCGLWMMPNIVESCHSESCQIIYKLYVSGRRKAPKRPTTVCCGHQKWGATVGHVPFNLAPERSCNKGLLEPEVTGYRVNRGAGYRLEIPCKYQFYGSTLYIARLETIVYKQCSDGLLI